MLKSVCRLVKLNISTIKTRPYTAYNSVSNVLSNSETPKTQKVTTRTNTNSQYALKDNLQSDWAPNEKNYTEVDVDFFENPHTSVSDFSTSNHDFSFKYNELILCKIFRNESNVFSTRMIRLQKEGIFQTRNFQIFHKHIVEKSVNQVNSNENLNVSFRLLSMRVDFTRPTLYEYIVRKMQMAVSSHFSILSLVPLLLELKSNTKLLECGTGAGSMTLFLSQHLGHSGTIHTFDLTKAKVVKAKELFWDWKNSFDSTASSEATKWPDNVKFGVGNLCEHTFDESFTS